nr:AP-4 complex subunit epsilon [Ipomoea batatas]
MGNVINQLLRDLHSIQQKNESQASSSGDKGVRSRSTFKLINEEIILIVLPQVTKMLGYLKEAVRKKVIMALHWFYPKSPSSVHHLISNFRKKYLLYVFLDDVVDDRYGVVIQKLIPRTMQMHWHDARNKVDRGVFAMRHMKGFLGQ